MRAWLRSVLRAAPYAKDAAILALLVIVAWLFFWGVCTCP